MRELLSLEFKDDESQDHTSSVMHSFNTTVQTPERDSNTNSDESGFR